MINLLFRIIFIISLFYLFPINKPSAAETDRYTISTKIVKKDPDAFYLTKKTKNRTFDKVPSSTKVVLPNGKVLSKGEISRLSQYAKAMRKSRDKKLPKGLTKKPRKRGFAVANSNDLLKALNKGDEETLILPSGKRITAGLLKLVRPQVELQLGRSLTHTTIQAPPIKVNKNSDWESIFLMPDTTRLQSPDGTIITLAQLKYSLKDNTMKKFKKNGKRRAR